MSHNDDSYTHGTGRNDQDLYRFDIQNGAVVRVQEWDEGRWKSERMDADEVYTLEGTDVIKTEIETYGREVTRYVDPEGDGLYAKFSEQWLPATNATGGMTPVTTQTLYSRGGDTDDHLAVRPGQDPALGGQGSDTFVVREWGHVVIGDFHHHQQDRLVFDMGQGVQSLEDLVQRLTDLRWQGDDLVLEMGDQASVMLLGVRTNGIAVEDMDFLS
ncbi:MULTISPECIES: hypothetical protein [Giesbergeria]|uniref:Uncharacterized protein n=1 Tax=Giesbergeria sinuosa TaxID=80883 RepID=A0ABV9QF05_9BURK